MGISDRTKNIVAGLRARARESVRDYLGFVDAPMARPVVEEVSAEETTKGELLEPRDEILKTHGQGNLALYERLLTDDQVWSTFRQRRTEVIAREWKVDPGGTAEIDKAAADDLRAQMTKIGWDRACYKMLAGLMCGYGVGECMFALEPGTDRVLLAKVKVRRSARFGFAPDGGLRIKRSGKVEVLPDRKFWVYSCGSDNDDDPYGLGMGHPLYWPVWLKRNGLKFWSLFLEAFASPTAKAVVPPGTDEIERKKLLELLGRIRNGGKIVVPRGVDVELMQALRSSGGDFDQFLARLDAMIAKIVLMQTMTTDQGSSLSQAQIHYKVGQQGAKSDSDLLDESFCMGPAKWLTNWNHPGAATPIVYRDFGIAEDLKALAERDQVLSGMGYRPKASYIKQTYGDNYDYVPPVDPSALTPGASAAPMAFADPLPGSTVDNLLADGGWQKVMGPEVARIDALLARCHSLEEFRDRLGELVFADPDKLTEALARIMFTARVAGNVNAEERDGGND